MHYNRMQPWIQQYFGEIGGSRVIAKNRRHIGTKQAQKIGHT
jgi:hypothetical protein